jgi:hypothetical protein
MKTPVQHLEKDIQKIEKGLVHFAPGDIRDAMETALQNARQTLANFTEVERLTRNEEGLN